MNYIIMDLEWNSTHSKKLNKGFNEIIEIGAIKLDENLNLAGKFDSFVCPTSKRISPYCEKITGLTYDFLEKNGIPFQSAISDFAKWCKGNDNLIMSWSNSDLYALVENYQVFFGSSYISFIKRYMDLQKYCQSFDEDSSSQMSLSNFAGLHNIDFDESVLHRALNDCALEAKCLIKFFDLHKVQQQLEPCSRHYFKKIAFTPYYLNNPHGRLYDVDDDTFTCKSCNSKMTVKSIISKNNQFILNCHCDACDSDYIVYEKVQKRYEGINVTKKYRLIDAW